jgi:hypothetical protein
MLLDLEYSKNLPQLMINTLFSNQGFYPNMGFYLVEFLMRFIHHLEEER